jgi:transcriptional regulator with XRE-family HTH domain
VDNRIEVREFLATRRARLAPDQVGLPNIGGTRRVAGLRREEVALLAGVSVEYYTRLERGSLRGVSESVLEALARALQLDDTERAHLLDLARAANTTASTARTRRSLSPRRIRPGVHRVLDAITAPAWIRNGRSDVLALNALGQALYSPVLDSPIRPANTARFLFLDPRSADFYIDWEQAATEIVGALRVEAGRNPQDRSLSNLVGELSTRSEEFRVRWAHHVRQHRTGIKRLHHPIVGDLDLTYEALELTEDPGLSLVVYTAEPGSPTRDAVTLLASWAATAETQASMSAESHIPEETDRTESG